MPEFTTDSASPSNETSWDLQALADALDSALRGPVLSVGPNACSFRRVSPGVAHVPTTRDRGGVAFDVQAKAYDRSTGEQQYEGIAQIRFLDTLYDSSVVELVVEPTRTQNDVVALLSAFVGKIPGVVGVVRVSNDSWRLEQSGLGDLQVRQRIMGIEQEFAMDYDVGRNAQGQVPGGSRNLPESAPEIDAAGMLDNRYDGTPDTFFINGSRVYADVNHPEHATPECTLARDVARYDLAGERAMEVARADFEDRVSHVIDNRFRLIVSKRNVDRTGKASWGTHENYLTDARLPITRIEDELASFLVSRPILVGAGGLVWNGRHHEFAISPRGLSVLCPVASDAVRSKPAIMLRDESHGQPEHRRIQVVAAEGNRFGVATYLKMGITHLLLRHIESDNPALRELAVSDMVSDIVNVAGGTGVRTPITLADGRTVSALEHQQLYHQKISSFVEWNGASVEELDVLERWGALLDGLDADPLSVSDRVEWVAKKHLFDRAVERGATGYDDARVHAIDDSFVSIDPQFDTVRRLLAAGRIESLFTADELDYARAYPPPTRAQARVEAMRFADERQLKAHVSWSRVRFTDTTLPDIDLPDPYNPLPESMAHVLRDIETTLAFRDWWPTAEL